MNERNRPVWVGLGGGLTAARLGWGAGLVLAPGLMVSALGGADTVGSRRVARVLGVRHLLQGVWARGSAEERLRLGALIDASHAVSAVAFALLDRRWRRAAVADAAIATAFGLGGIELLEQRRGWLTRERPGAAKSLLNAAPHSVVIGPMVARDKVEAFKETMKNHRSR